MKFPFNTLNLLAVNVIRYYYNQDSLIKLLLTQQRAPLSSLVKQGPLRI